jgi:methylmalonyl-CoA mutase
MQTKFPEVSKAEWLAKVEKDLKGKPLSGLNFEVAGQTFTPFHHRETRVNNYPPVQRTSDRVGIGVIINAQEPIAANKTALKALTQGSNEILYTCNVDSWHQNLQTTRFDSWEDYTLQLTAGIHLEMAKVHLFSESDHGDNTVTLGEKVYNADGRCMKPISSFPGLLVGACQTYAHFREMDVHTKPFTINFWLATSDDYLTNLAYFRACRLCWQQITTIIPGLNPDCRLMAYIRTPFQRDAETAKISATAHASSAISGGADSVFVAPFSDASKAVGKSDFDLRIGLNIQHILELESSMGQVKDPAAGSYYIEELTDHLAQKMWTVIQRLFANTSERTKLYALMQDLPTPVSPKTEDK